ncbi:MAG TPA: sugar transferase [Candidatus Dormibacteraeota bacterium]|jgi:lipopolysaccharide/colanic/teichoic acid biosynthesis glycosyltransferase|nr:sugar transferase [Candidatus Dormibacteraeota bacterium]
MQEFKQELEVPRGPLNEGAVTRMPNTQRKLNTRAERRIPAGNSKRTATGLGHIPTRREDVLGEETFRAMLALERRRSQRSSQPFVLMLLDASSLHRDLRGASFLEKLVSLVSGVIRESDIVGWYQKDTVLAAIFTEITLNEDGSIPEALQSKFFELLEANIEHKIASKLVVTVHLFPESLGNDGPDERADKKLYPDISGQTGTRRLPMIIKRGIDILGSALLLLILSPVFAVLAALIKLTSKGPVIFKQERLGQFGKTFQCLKFRTMQVNNDSQIHRDYVKGFIAGKAKQEKCGEASGVVYKIKNDPRVTPIGSFLRRMSLDELPQFWNVLRGEMSLVGPRPSLAYEFEAYDFWHQRRVLEVKPGVTGLWQVMGRSRTTFDDMVRMDLSYSQKWSLWLDIKILLATPLAVFTGYGAY